LCRDCKGKVIDKLATYEKEENPTITESGEKNNLISNSQLAVIQNKPVNSQNNNSDIDDLKKKINDLQIENDRKDKIIQVQTNRIKELKRELINKKINFKEEKLEDLIQKLEVSRPKIIQLRNAYEQLIKAKNDCNLVAIKKAEETIEEIKNGLLTEVEKTEGMRKIFHKCEKMAKLRLKREQIYEAKIELLSS
jgi:hypothetical protein